MTFQIGDKVIYPNHGLGIIERIEEKTILGTTCGFYSLRIASNETMVLVPVGNADSVGLRRAIGDTEVDRLFRILGDGKIDSQQNWKGRFKDNSEKMRSGSIYDVADVLKSLTLLSKSKNLSFREKRMLDRARFLVVSEISEVLQERPGGHRVARRSRARPLARHQVACDRAGQGRQGPAIARGRSPRGARLVGAIARSSTGFREAWVAKRSRPFVYHASDAFFRRRARRRGPRGRAAPPRRRVRRRGDSLVRHLPGHFGLRHPGRSAWPAHRVALQVARPALRALARRRGTGARALGDYVATGGRARRIPGDERPSTARITRATSTRRSCSTCSTRGCTCSTRRSSAGCRFWPAARVAGFIPVERQNHEQSQRAVDLAAESVARGHSFLVFPGRHAKPHR